MESIFVLNVYGCFRCCFFKDFLEGDKGASLVAVDFFMAGATIVIIRPQHWKRCSLEDIKQYTENPVYYELSKEDQGCSLGQSDGYVIIDTQDIIYSSQLSPIISRLETTKPVYIYDNNGSTLNYWKDRENIGRIIDLEHYKKG